MPNCFKVAFLDSPSTGTKLSNIGVLIIHENGTISQENLNEVSYDPDLASETITVSGSISEIVYLSPVLSESVSKALSISEQVYLKCLLSEIIDSAVDAESFKYCYCNLDVTIKPGSVLIVDAVNYNIFLDGENIVYVHSGDWLDELNRTTQSLKITGTGSTNLSASILYTENYL